MRSKDAPAPLPLFLSRVSRIALVAWTLALGACGGGTGATGTTGGGAGSANPPGTVQFAAAAFTAAESTGSAAVTLTRSGGSQGPASVQITTGGGDATPGADYTALDHQVVNWAAGDMVPKTIPLAITADAIAEGNETLDLTLSNASGAALGAPATAVLNISDGAGAIQFGAASLSVNENAGIVSVTVTRSGGSGPASADYAVSGGTATAGSDYTLASGTLTWADGDIAPKSIDVSIIDDAIQEGDETIELALSAPGGGAVLGPRSSAVLTIADNDDPGTLQFSAAGYTGSESSGRATIAVTRVGGSAGAASVRVTTRDGSATAPADYAAVDRLLEWSAGDMAPKTFDVSIVNDGVMENDETVNLALDGVTGAVLGAPSSAVLTLTDRAGTIQFNQAAFSINETEGNVTIEVIRFDGNSGPVSVHYATSDGSATSGADYIANSGTINWASGESGNKTFVVEIRDDGAAEGDETIHMTLTSPAGGAVLGGQDTALLTILDDPTGTLQFSNASYSVGESAGMAPVTVTRIGGIEGTVSARVSTANGSATAGNDYSATVQTLSWGPGDANPQTVNIPITNDALVEGNETVNLTLDQVSTAGAGAPGTAVLTIVDDDR